MPDGGKKRGLHTPEFFQPLHVRPFSGECAGIAHRQPRFQRQRFQKRLLVIGKRARRPLTDRQRADHLFIGTEHHCGDTFCRQGSKQFR